MNRVTASRLIFIAATTLFCYLAVIYFALDQLEAEYHHKDKNHAKVSEAMKMAVKTKLAENKIYEDVSEKIPFDFPKQKITPRLHDEYDYYGRPPGGRFGRFRARNRYKSLQLVKTALRNQVNSLIHYVKEMIRENIFLERKRGYYTRMKSVEIFYEELTFSRIQMFYKRVKHGVYSQSFRVLLRKRRYHRYLYLHLVKRKHETGRLKLALCVLDKLYRLLDSLNGRKTMPKY